MANLSPCLAQLSRICVSSGRPTASLPARFLAPTIQIRTAFVPKITSKKVLDKPKTGNTNPQKNKKKGSAEKKKKKSKTTYQQYDMKDADTFALCDAMRYVLGINCIAVHFLMTSRYLRAFEVGRRPTSVKYEVAVKLKSLKNGPVVRNRLRLPHPVKTDIRICVICPADSKYAKDALAAGATLVGEEEVFEKIKEGVIEFDRCICQTDSLAKMNKAALGRILGPKGLMPSTKLGTVAKDPSVLLKDMIGGAEYREKLGVVRMAIGQLGFTPEDMQRNIKAFIESVKKDMAQMSDKISKEIAEVVLSSTNGPGFPLNGAFIDVKGNGTTPKDLSG